MTSPNHDLHYKLAAYGLGKLEPTEHDAVARHLSDCAAARAEYAELTAVFQKMRTTPDGQPIPPEMLFLDGPPDRTGDAPLRGALAQLAADISANHGVPADAIPDHGTPNDELPNHGAPHADGSHGGGSNGGGLNGGGVRGTAAPGGDSLTARDGAGMEYRWLSLGVPDSELHRLDRPAQLAVIAGGARSSAALPNDDQQAAPVRALARRRREVTILAAAAALVAALLGAGWVGRLSAPDVVLAAPAPPPPPPVAASGPPGRLLVASTNGDSGDAVAASAVLTPADGWVGLAATVSGLSPGQQCALVVITRDGAAVPAGSWVVGSSPGPGGPPTIRGSAAVPADQVTAIVVREREASGKDIVSIPAV